MQQQQQQLRGHSTEKEKLVWTRPVHIIFWPSFCSFFVLFSFGLSIYIYTERMGEQVK